MSEIEILIENEGIIYKPLVQEGITWETERMGAPGKLTFSILNDNSNSVMRLNIQEGNRVTMRYKKEPVFTGFLFTKKRNKDQLISITAYDQLRYLKNKYSYEYENKKASEIVQMIADDFQLTTGEIDDTEIALSRREDAQTLFDIILNALDDTVRLNQKQYVLYDDFGKITLKDIEHLKLDCLVTEETAENFDYETSIDKETYNRVILYYDDEETKKRIPYPVEDSYNISKWGILQFFQKIDNPEKGWEMAEGYLKLHNSKRRTLSVSGVLGDIRVRGGVSIPVHLTLGDINANTYLLAEKVKHSFKDNEHRMDITLRGDFFV